MADITNPEVLKFHADYLRPLAEIARDFQVAAEDAKTKWQTTIAAKLSGNADSDPVVDGRAAEGVTQVTKKDLDELISMLSAILTELDANTAHAVPITRASLRALFAVNGQGSRFTISG